LLLIASWNLTINSTNERLLDLELGPIIGQAARYSGVEFVRVDIISAFSFGVNVPRIGDIFLGRRRQLPHFPNAPYDKTPLESQVSDFESLNGDTQRVVKKRGRMVKPLRLVTGGIGEPYDYKNEIREWYRQTGQGTRRFWWIDDPATAPEARQVLLREPRLVMPLLGPNASEANLTIVEQPPFLTQEQGG